jgi:hypothetical protein
MRIALRRFEVPLATLNHRSLRGGAQGGMRRHRRCSRARNGRADKIALRLERFPCRLTRLGFLWRNFGIHPAGWEVEASMDGMSTVAGFAGSGCLGD